MKRIIIVALPFLLACQRELSFPPDVTCETEIEHQTFDTPSQGWSWSGRGYTANGSMLFNVREGHPFIIAAPPYKFEKTITAKFHYRGDNRAANVKMSFVVNGAVAKTGSMKEGDNLIDERFDVPSGTGSLQIVFEQDSQDASYFTLDDISVSVPCR
jgi:hypothetical protein